MGTHFSEKTAALKDALARKGQIRFSGRVRIRFSGSVRIRFSA
jgi:hypothetical protein